MNTIFQKDISTDITQFLKDNTDLKYRDFSSSLIPTLNKDKVLGVRVPLLRKFAKQIHHSDCANDFLMSLPHTYLEENHLHAFLIEQEKDFIKAINLTQSFLPHIDNWATCDSLRPKVFKKHHDLLFPYIKSWISSEHTYTKRFAIGMLLSFYLDDNFEPSHLKLVSGIKSDEYYINMMIAWYFATAIAKQPTHAVPYIENRTLSVFTHNKTINKACESFRVDADTKSYLKTLKITQSEVPI